MPKGAATHSPDDEGEALFEGPVYRGKLFTTTNTEEMKRRNTIRGMCALLFLLLGVAFIVVDNKANEETSRASSFSRKKVPKGACPKLCKARFDQRMTHHGVDFLQTPKLLNQFKSAKEKIVKTLRSRYGEFYEPIMLNNTNKWRQGFVAAGGDVSKDRFRRKMQIKVLQMQVHLMEENANLEGCNCSSSNAGRHLQEEATSTTQELVLPELQQTYSKFVWSTGGHSAAAGHGNLYNESYTAYMESMAKPIFEAVGIEFIGRNYAMGGTRSGPEAALCSEQVYGSDADVISWDSSMTDVSRNWRQYLYNSRAGLNPGRPAVVGINMNGRSLKQRIEILEKNVGEGLTGFYLDIELINEMIAAVPDQFGKSEVEIAATPDYVRDFKCDGEIEKGDPYCGAHKYNEALCSKRQHKTNWHPGFKTMSLYGSLMAFFVVDALEDAIQSLGEGYNPKEKLAELIKSEDEDYDKFSTQVLEKGKLLFDMSTAGDLLNNSELDLDMLFHSPAICHTALVPAEIRYKGILTGEEGSFFKYDQGTSMVAADETQATGAMRLVYDERERNPPCPVPTKVDFKDMFYATHKDGWTNMIIPNDREIEAYQPSWKPKGVLMFCLVPCAWGKCKEGDVRGSAILNKTLKMKINNEEVIELVAKETECAVAKHKGGLEFKPLKDGKFKIEVKVEENGEKLQYVRITSVIMF